MARKIFQRTALTLLLSSINIGVCWAASAEVAAVNNEGVRALNRGDFAAAISRFSEALKLDPSYVIGKENLAIAYNNYGLKAPTGEALKYFHQSYYLNPGNATTLQNIDAIVKFLGKKPDSFADRVSLAEKALADKDYAGAIVEYRIALKIKDDPAITQKLNAVPVPKDYLQVPGTVASKPSSSGSTAPSSSSSSSSSSFSSKHPTSSVAKGAINYDAMLLDVQRRVKAIWTPPPNMNEDQTVGVDFNVGADGTISDVKFSSERTYKDDIDNACVDTIRRLGKVAPPPPGAAPAPMYFSFVKKIGDGSDRVSCSKTDFGPFMAHLQRKIKAGWLPPKGKESRRIVAQFKIERDGHFDSVKITKGSGFADADQAALDAVKAVDRFAALPSGSPKFVDIEFTFDYNVLNKDGSRVTAAGDNDVPKGRVGVDYSMFLANAQRRIAAKWLPPEGMGDRLAVVTFKVYKDGHLSGVKLENGSGDSAVDKAVLDTMSRVDSIEMLPSGAPVPTTVRFVFAKKFWGTNESVCIDDLDYTNFLTDLTSGVKTLWKQPPGGTAGNIEVVCGVNRAGKTSSHRISKSSGSAKDDTAALDAVRLLGITRVPPSGSPNTIDVAVRFHGKEKIETLLKCDADVKPFAVASDTPPAAKPPTAPSTEPPAKTVAAEPPARAVAADPPPKPSSSSATGSASSSGSSPNNSTSKIASGSDGGLSDRLLGEADTAMTSKDFESAINVLETALKMLPDDQKPKVRKRLSEACDQHGMSVKADSHLALKHLHRSVVLDPDNASAKQHLDEVIKSSGKAPDSFATRLALAEESRSVGDLDSAEYEYNRALDIKEDSTARSKLNEIPALRSYVEQVKMFESQLSKSPTSVEAHMGLAQALLQLGRLEKAEEEFKKVLSLDSGNGVAKQRLGAIEKARADQRTAGAK